MLLLKCLLFIAVFISFQGCTILSHLDELSMMGDYSRDKDDQHKLIKKMDANYEALVIAIDSKQMDRYPSQADVRSTFGDPILIKEIVVDGQKQQRWLYRKGLIKTAKDKTYLYFDSQGKLIKYQQENIQWKS